MASIAAAEAGARVTLFEQNGEVGKKILASGNGRCNIINTSASPEDYAGKSPAFARYALQSMDFKTFTKFCRRIGLLLEVKPDGRCYPLSNEARAVRGALLRYARRVGVTLLTDSPVRTLEHSEGFRIATNSEVRTFDAVVIATGSPAAPQLGGNDSGLAFAKALGHDVVPFYPSLVQLHLRHSALLKMSGVKTEASAALLVTGKRVAEAAGDILFTRYGISGFAILDISQAASFALERSSRVGLQLDLLPNFDAQSLSAQIKSMAEGLGEYPLVDLLTGLLPHKLITPLMADANLPSTTRCADLNAKTLRQLVYAIKQWRFDVTATHGFAHAEVAGGGVCTEAIDEKTMASEIVPGLYFAGEVIDIVGRRGGFNFHFAWASGALAGRNAAGPA